MPFTSDADLQAALVKAGTPPEVATAALEVNKEARLAGLRAAVALLALIALLALVLHQSNPDAIARTVCGIRRMIKSTIVSLIGSRALLACDVVVLGAPGARPARRRPRGLRAGSHGADLGSEVQLPRNDQVGYPFHCQVRT